MKNHYHYLPLSDEIRALPLYLLAAGSAHLPAGADYPPPGHPPDHLFHWPLGRVLPEYQVIYIARGSGRLETKTGGVRPVGAGDLFVLFPGEWHRYSPDSETGWEEHWASFHGSRAGALTAAHGVSREMPLLRAGSPDLLRREFAEIAEEVAEEAAGYQGVASARLHLVFALASASRQRQSDPSADALEIIKRAKERLRARLDSPTDPEALAAELGVSYSWLRKVFRQQTGLPPAQYQAQLRLSHACELLRSTALPIAAVGTRCGFESAYYFARVFRGKAGCTPSEYRRQSRRPAAL